MLNFVKKKIPEAMSSASDSFPSVLGFQLSLFLKGLHVIESNVIWPTYTFLPKGNWSRLADRQMAKRHLANRQGHESFGRQTFAHKSFGWQMLLKKSFGLQTIWQKSFCQQNLPTSKMKGMSLALTEGKSLEMACASFFSARVGLVNCRGRTIAFRQNET